MKMTPMMNRANQTLRTKGSLLAFLNLLRLNTKGTLKLVKNYFKIRSGKPGGTKPDGEKRHP